jgi:hypothetical protein
MVESSCWICPGRFGCARAGFFSYTFQHLAANGNVWKASDIEQVRRANAMIALRFS